MLLCSRVCWCRVAAPAAAGVASAAQASRHQGRRRVGKGSVQFRQRGVCAVPHPAKAHRGGEDAFFAHAYGIGVADGVGGYAAHGVDPALYTRHLMQFALQSVSAATSHSAMCGVATQTDVEARQKNGTRGCSTDEQGVDALELLRDSVHKVAQLQQPGGCPVVVVTLTDKDHASILNLGDCGVLMVRAGKLMYRSAVQQHTFNCPYQLPDDAPEAGERATIEVQDGDVFLCASDGVYDNVDVSELVAQLAEVGRVKCAHAASAIGRLASQYARSSTRMTPFALHARDAGYAYQGGKLDDITALVARVATASECGADADVCPALITDLLHLPS